MNHNLIWGFTTVSTFLLFEILFEFFKKVKPLRFVYGIRGNLERNSSPNNLWLYIVYTMDINKKKEIKQSWIDYLYQIITDLRIPEKEWLKFKSYLSVLHLEKNEYLVSEGDVPRKMAFVISGIFRAFYLTESGDEKTIVFRGKGKPLSAYSSFIKNQYSKFSIQALEDSVLLYISIKDFEKLLSGDSFWQINTGKYYMNIFIEKEKREREFLSDDAETRYKNFLTEYPGLENKINHYHIASYLGISNVTLSRIRNKLLR